MCCAPRAPNPKRSTPSCRRCAKPGSKAHRCPSASTTTAGNDSCSSRATSRCRRIRRGPRTTPLWHRPRRCSRSSTTQRRTSTPPLTPGAPRWPTPPGARSCATTMSASRTSCSIAASPSACSTSTSVPRAAQSTTSLSSPGCACPSTTTPTPPGWAGMPRTASHGSGWSPTRTGSTLTGGPSCSQRWKSPWTAAASSCAGGSRPATRSSSRCGTRWAARSGSPAVGGGGQSTETASPTPLTASRDAGDDRLRRTLGARVLARGTSRCRGRGHGRPRHG